MRRTRELMGMPVTIEIVGAASSCLHEEAFALFEMADRRFSTFRADSEIAAINDGRVGAQSASEDMREVLALAERTRQETDGFFDIRAPHGRLDPSGIVKGWAILKAANLLLSRGADDFYVDAGGDIQSRGRSSGGRSWSVGIRNPFKTDEIVKVIHPRGRGVATSGCYERGQHIYNPHAPQEAVCNVVSLTVIGPDVLEADRFATAAFAMGKDGIHFIEALDGFEGYAIDPTGIATMTSGFAALVSP